jgi:hypothetical protein
VTPRAAWIQVLTDSPTNDDVLTVSGGSLDLCSTAPGGGRPMRLADSLRRGQAHERASEHCKTSELPWQCRQRPARDRGGRPTWLARPEDPKGSSLEAQRESESPLTRCFNSTT